MAKKKRGVDGRRSILGHLDDIVQDNFWAVVFILFALLAIQISPFLSNNLLLLFLFKSKTPSVDHSTDPLYFAALREAVIREGGYVHSDLGMLVPAPSGAYRGLGMISDHYNECQIYCKPGGDDESHLTPSIVNTIPLPKGYDLLAELDKQLSFNQDLTPIFQQERILIEVPLSYQMTRPLALKTLFPLFPSELMNQKPIAELDDAILLTLLLAHERGKGLKSKFKPYIDTLPNQPECGYSRMLRQDAERIISIMADLGLNVSGWPEELNKARARAKLIAESISETYGAYIAREANESSHGSIEWALCHVASRATAGSTRYGALRMIPIVDMINHNIDSGRILEVKSFDNVYDGSLRNKSPGSIYVSSMRHGILKPLKKQQELLVDYNVPMYSPLDWFISLGFVPPERYAPWKKVPSAELSSSNSNATTYV